MSPSLATTFSFKHYPATYQSQQCTLSQQQPLFRSQASLVKAVCPSIPSAQQPKDAKIITKANPSGFPYPLLSIQHSHSPTHPPFRHERAIHPTRSLQSPRTPLQQIRLPLQSQRRPRTWTTPVTRFTLSATVHVRCRCSARIGRRGLVTIIE